MSDSSPEPSEEKRSEGSVTIPDPRQRGLDLPMPPALQSLIDLEKQRIESFNQRTDVVRFAIETNDAADKRQFEYQMAKLDAESDSSNRRHSLMRRVLYTGGSATILTVAFLLGMTFMGSPEQSKLALSCLQVLMIGGGGYGVINGLIAGFRRLSNE